MKDLLKLIALGLGIVAVISIYPVARCAAYDYDWRCMVGDCRIVKCNDGRTLSVEVE